MHSAHLCFGVNCFFLSTEKAHFDNEVAETGGIDFEGS